MSEWPPQENQEPPQGFQPAAPLGYAGQYGQLPRGLATASMVCGIVSIPLLCLWYFAIPLAITAVVMGAIAKGQVNRREADGGGMAVAGIVCGCVSLAIAAVFIVVLIVAVSVAAVNGHH